MFENSSPVYAVIRRILNPLVVVMTVVVVCLLIGRPIDGYFVMLAVVSFFLSAQVYEEIGLDRCWRRTNYLLHMRDILVGWAIIVSVLLFNGYMSKLSSAYSRSVLLTWFAITPPVLYISHLAARYVLYRLSRSGRDVRKAIIVGATELADKLANKLREDTYLRIGLAGFFDDRSSERLPSKFKPALLGRVEDVAAYVREHHVNLIYITLPLAAQPRIVRLIDELRDTTASVFFVPDIFVFDLMHAQFGKIYGIPVISVRDAPIRGINQFNKRLSDLIFASFILILIAPIMIAIAGGGKATSPGPIWFRQRRYGVEGEEIIVYKFRSMTVCEDGKEVVQAKRQDQRITPFGAFLRRSSLDELPQLVNVLQGRMSVVGPRPPAVAHNEQYRKLIKGYMLRHKVKPGSTGWAQVNGLRGETETLDKMRARGQYDIDYMRNWSLVFDLMIIG